PPALQTLRVAATLFVESGCKRRALAARASFAVGHQLLRRRELLWRAGLGTDDRSALSRHEGAVVCNDDKFAWSGSRTGLRSSLEALTARASRGRRRIEGLSARAFIGRADPEALAVRASCAGRQHEGLAPRCSCEPRPRRRLEQRRGRLRASREGLDVRGSRERYTPRRLPYSSRRTRPCLRRRPP
ncbi:MAG: hypothetical protein QOH21_1007, partial [Acidobacteriota bacterium]|nr:hypothetical protein [Acidobacteriota bacterium]